MRQKSRLASDLRKNARQDGLQEKRHRTDVGRRSRDTAVVEHIRQRRRDDDHVRHFRKRFRHLREFKRQRMLRRQKNQWE